MKSRGTQTSVLLADISRVSFIALLLVLSATVYLPGIAGPWIFDDFPNLLRNTYLHIRSLDYQTLWNAAYSLEAGPLKRPIAMLSFALNHYLAGSFASTVPFKAVNLTLHVVNALLVFWLLLLVLRRTAEVEGKTANARTLTKYQIWLAGGGALLWLVHPIQLTSVLYVVQRMTELSALFTFAGLISYLVARQQVIAGHRHYLWLAILAPLGFGILGALSKENAILLPIFILAIEYILYARETPWRTFARLPVVTQRTIVAGAIIVVAILATVVTAKMLPSYSARPFSLGERLMTEARVLFFYLSLILVPRINRFGHVHDDIEVSRALFDPWTTLPAVLGVVALVAGAFWLRRRQPLVALGVLWFFAAHLLESTVVPLEIAHEHRNYVALLGPVLILIHTLRWAVQYTKNRRVWACLPIFALACMGVTFQRASQWADYETFYRYEAEHHPNSARVQAGLGIILDMTGRQAEALRALRRAAEIESFDAGFMMMVQLTAAEAGYELRSDDQYETLKRLREGPFTTITTIALTEAGECVTKRCFAARYHIEEWLEQTLRRIPTPDRSFVHYLRGRTLLAQGKMAEAMAAYRLSHELDKSYLHPLFELAQIHLVLKDIEGAKRIYADLSQANRNSRYPRDANLTQLATEIVKHEALLRDKNVQK